ncbi:hypothetical protein H2201_008527 [Coniosporium apollinis]|uniref:Heterokaryon incompatibility domain-containing protein n=1 Tax=Coniosporium apollinis TaxID=61459 RepID=A0ABQ9NL62_9PEZI|nr:hypothetical protein H2201_008527 [Coniosporium apollinis]
MKRKTPASEPPNADTSAHPDVRKPDTSGLLSSSAQSPSAKRRCRVGNTNRGSNWDFQYQPLAERQIRLLRYIRPRQLRSSHIAGEKHLEFGIHHASLIEPPEYLALSYAWRNPTPCLTVYCNGERLMITQNLGGALRAAIYAIHHEDSEIWTKDEDIYLWADGISVNQWDIPEKNIQVPQMGEIFQKARGAIGYIGAPRYGSPASGLAAMARWGGVVECPHEVAEL